MGELIWGWVVGTFWFMIIGAVGGGIWAYATEASVETGSSTGAVIGIAIGIVGCVWAVVTTHSDEQDKRQARDRGQVEAERMASKSRLLGAERNLVNNADAAVRHFAALPAALTSANHHTERAQYYFKDGAYSPFWSAIESAYSDVASYANGIDQITQKAASHPTLVGSLVAAGGNPGILATFPVKFDTGHTTRVLTEATDNLSEMVYQAQKDPVFSQIWEQRRTTAAVIKGFANLEQAVIRMASTVTSAVKSLESTLDSSGRDIHAELGRMSAGAAQASQDQLNAMTALNSRANAIRGEVYRQNWGHYPMH